jgi:hypothetical protein
MAELLKVSKPELLKEWDYERNEAINTEHVRVNAAGSAWWICSRDSSHRWRAKIRNRAIDGNGCPYCSGRKTLRPDSFGMLYPGLVAELHPAKNIGFDPYSTAPGSNKTVWWVCGCSHEWLGQVNKRVRTGSGCPKCVRIKGRPTIASSILSDEFHPTKNTNVRPDAITLGSRLRVWWQCLANPEHEWKESVHYRAKTGNKCPKCEPRNNVAGMRLEEYSITLAHEWHSDLNGTLTPKDVSAGSKRKVWWKCSSNSQHAPWSASIYNRAHLKQGCPACYERAFAEERSVAKRYPRLAAHWHPTKNGSLTPNKVTYGSSRSVWWRCAKNPEHEWDALINLRTLKGQGCPYCARRRLTADSNLEVQFPRIAAEWHPTKNDSLKPLNVAAKSARKVWWRCAVNPVHEWPAQIKNRTIRKTGCPHCAQENNVLQILRELGKSSYNTTDVYRVFLINLKSVERLAKMPPSTIPLKTLYFRMLYAQVITALEAYLADAFLRLVVAKAEFKKRLLTEIQEFKERKFSFADILQLNPSGDDAIAHMLSEISWHNIAKARALYSTVLGVELPGDLASLFKAVTNRHDIVHRSGKSIKGRMVAVGESELSTLLTIVRDFVRQLDEKLAILSSK